LVLVLVCVLVLVLVCVLLLAATLAGLICGEIEDHRLEFLPGYGKLAARQWSGYIDVPVVGINTTAHVHYWFVENSKGDENAPTVVWMQGGPGGSSMIGLFTENGPYMLNDFSLKNRSFYSPKVFDNPHSWHHLPANMLYVEHPAPTGFSYCSPSACKWNDETQSTVSFEFMVRFFNEYPEFADRDFFLSGESYAGVLVPTLAHQILKHRTESNRDQAPYNLKGFMLGNACPGNRVYTCTPYSGWIGTEVALEFRYFHGMIPEETYKKIRDACEGQWGTYEAPESLKCRQLLEDPTDPVKSMTGSINDMGGGYFLYDTCKDDLSAKSSGQELASRSLQDNNLHSSPNSGEYFCGQERAALQYLNLPKVQERLHVRPTKFSFNTALNYEYTAHSLLELYKNTLSPAFDILQFSGDADPCVPYIGTQRWINSLDLPVKHPWAPWIVPGSKQPAGYRTIMTSHGGKKFAFATVRDAGHMVPRYKPSEALHLIKRFVDGSIDAL